MTMRRHLDDSSLLLARTKSSRSTCCGEASRRRNATLMRTVNRQPWFPCEGLVEPIRIRNANNVITPRQQKCKLHVKTPIPPTKITMQMHNNKSRNQTTQHHNKSGHRDKALLSLLVLAARMQFICCQNVRKRTPNKNESKKHKGHKHKETPKHYRNARIQNS